MDFTFEPETIEKVKRLIADNQVFAITTHYNSDGDAIGSSTAFAEVLRQMGKTVKILLPNDYPAFFRWMHGVEDILSLDRHSKEVQKFIASMDVLICLDINQLSRTEDLEHFFEQSNKPRIVIDHHINLQIEADAAFSFHKASSTCELVYHILRACGYEKFIDKHVAESLYTGIMTDTGRLDYSSNYPEVYEVMGTLVGMGINKAKIHDKINNVFNYDRFRLQSAVMKDNFTYMPDYHAGYMFISNANKREYNFQLGDSEGFVNMPLCIRDLKFVALFTEYEKGPVKASFRSKGDFPANEFATKLFNGGGHFNAAGGKYFGTLDEAIQAFKDGLEKYRDKLDKK